jgi:hypothetical protein
MLRAVPLLCCVCEEEVVAGAEHWPNAWERSRKRFACCGPACAGSFNPDQHWIPSLPPAPASPSDSDRLIGVLRTRLKNGDLPSVVTRELLVAGVSAELVRGTLLESQAAGARSHREESERALLGVFFGRFISGKRDRREPKTFESAFDDVDRWSAAMAKRESTT